MTRSFVKSALCLPLALVCLLGLAGKASARPDENISGSWTLMAGLDRSLGNSPISIYFSNKGEVSGSTVCNTYTAKYRQRYGMEIQISDLVTTPKKDCADSNPLSKQ